MNYFLLYFFTLLIVFSTIGYGFLLSRIVNKDLIKFNLGYIGLLGLLTLTIISYITIFFTSHNYAHNLILHFIGIFLFIYNIKTLKLDKEVLKLLILFSILFLGMLIIRNHDDFNYYHFTYSYGLTQNKLMLGLGNFQHGYKHHSSLFFFNSITYLPFIKFYLFHAVGWITFLFTNFIILKFILQKKNLKEFSFKLIFYIVTFLFINVKFARVGGFGTDISGQLIMFILLPLIYSSLVKKELKSNLDLSILLISYVTTLKSFFILNFLFLFSYFFFFKIKDLIKYFLNTKSVLISFFTISLLISINISYTGCAIYPIKQTCLFKNISWTISEKHVDHLSKWYEIWSKSGAGPNNYGVKDSLIYIQKFNWVSNWYKNYFEYKGYETLLGIAVIFILLLIIFYSKNIKPPKKINKKIISILYALSFILFFEWFYNRPSLRYGGYYLFCFFFFIPFSYFISRYKLDYERIRTSVVSLVIISFLIFNIKNISRINKEQNMFKNDKNNIFPLYYAPIQTFKTIELEENINVYIPKGDGCYVTKTPCVGGGDGVYAKKILGFSAFIRKNK